MASMSAKSNDPYRVSGLPLVANIWKFSNCRWLSVMVTGSSQSLICTPYGSLTT